jgi:hypothetical protein
MSAMRQIALDMHSDDLDHQLSLAHAKTDHHVYSVDALDIHADTDRISAG